MEQDLVWSYGIKAQDGDNMIEERIKIVTGSDTGNTETVAKDIAKMICSKHDIHVDIVKVHEITPEDWDSHSFYILGAPTWFDGECSQDWNWYLNEFSELDFGGKQFALYGLGDQEGYPDYYNDAIGILAMIIEQNQGELVGHQFIDNEHKFNKSLGVLSGKKGFPARFYGCALDEDNQPHLTHVRLERWISVLSNYF